MCFKTAVSSSPFYIAVGGKDAFWAALGIFGGSTSSGHWDKILIIPVRYPVLTVHPRSNLFFFVLVKLLHVAFTAIYWQNQVMQTASTSLFDAGGCKSNHHVRQQPPAFMPETSNPFVTIQRLIQSLILAL